MEKLSRTVEVEDKFFDHVMGNWRRKRKQPAGVVMVLPRAGGKVLVMTKAFYPEGAFRLPSGAMQDGETPEETFHREIREETGFTADIADKLGEIDTDITHEGECVRHQMHIFLAEETSAEPRPEDKSEEISEFREIPVSELPKIAEQLRSLSAPWSGWGDFWSAAQDLTYRALKTEDNG